MPRSRKSRLAACRRAVRFSAAFSFETRILKKLPNDVSF
jgi:hypothetical protein